MNYTDQYLLKSLPDRIGRDRTRLPLRAESWPGTSSIDVYLSDSTYVLNVSLTIHGASEVLDWVIIRFQERQETRTLDRREIRSRALLLGGAWSLWTGVPEEDIQTFWRTLEPYIPALSNLDAWPSR